MAEKLSIQIALNGGAEIERQLADIGLAGQKAFAEIGKSAEQVGGFKQLDPKDVTAKLQEMGVTGVDSIKKIQDAVARAGKLETLVQGIASAENALAALGRAAVPVGVAIGAAMAAATKATISFAQSITSASEQAMKLGQGIEQFDRMRLALEGAGVSTQNVTGFVQRLTAAVDKANLDKVTKAAQGLRKATEGGTNFIPLKFDKSQAVADLNTLSVAAMKADEAGRRARETLQELGLPIPSGAKQTLGELIASTGSAEAGLKAFVEQLRQTPSAVEANKAAMDALGISANQLISAYDNLAAKGAGAITPDMVTQADAVTAAFNRMQSAFERLGTVSFAPLVVAELNAVTSAIEALQNMINNFSWQTFIDGAIAAGNALKFLTIPGLVSKGMEGAFGGGGSGASGSFAGGGLLGGGGTGTSDSNLAWVSRGEHIMPARAVRQPGVLAFLEALRRSGGNLSRVLDGMGRFALGGMVPRAIPAFATGGLAGGSSNVTIQFPGLPAIGGLRASSDVVDQLHKAAALAQVRSGGRKPSRYS